MNHEKSYQPTFNNYESEDVTRVSSLALDPRGVDVVLVHGI